MENLIERLKQCPECSCSRCNKYQTSACAINEAIVELRRFDQVITVFNQMVREER